jgi:hypothetical protein
MSFAEVLEAVREMPKEQRLRLAGELTALRMKEDPEYRARAGKLLHEARQGGLISKEELIRLQAKKF